MHPNNQNPFLGLKPYEEKDRKKLYGRDRDLFLMRDRIFSGRTTLLFAGSGVGKTSFIKAKIIPELQRQYNIIYHNQWSIGEPLTALVDSITSQYPPKPDAESPSPVGFAYAPLLAHLGDFSKGGANSQNKDTKGRCLIILDQFEEIFQYHSHQKYFTTFIDRLSEMINFTPCDSRVLFSMREEFLGELSVFDNKIPDLFGNYYRLKCPTKDEAKDIIERTCGLVHVPVDESKLKDMVRELTWIDRDDAVNGDGKQAPPVVEKDIVAPPYLQIACRGLWDSQFPRKELEETQKQVEENGTSGTVENLTVADTIEQNGHKLAPEVSAVSPPADQPAGQVVENDPGSIFLANYQSGDARKMLQRFCEKILSSFNTREISLLIEAFDYLVTKKGAKIAYELSSLAEHMNVKESELKPVLLRLSSNPNSRILRARGPDNALWFELYHDMYGPIIDEWRKAYRLRRQARIREAVERSVLILVVFALIAGAIWSLSHWLWKPNFYKNVLSQAKLEDPISYRNCQWAFNELSNTWGYGNTARRMWADAWIKRARLAEQQENGDEAFLSWLQAAAKGPRKPDPAVLSQIESYLSVDRYKYLLASFPFNATSPNSTPVFSADGSMVLSLTKDNRVSRWRIDSKILETSPVLELDNSTIPAPPPTSGATTSRRPSPPSDVPPDTQIQSAARNLIAGVNGGSVYIWRFDTGSALRIPDFTSGEQPQSKPTNQSVGYGGVNSPPPPRLSVSFTPDGGYFAVFKEHSVQVYNFKDKQKAPSPLGNPFDSVDQMLLSPDNHTLLLVLQDGRVQLRDLEKGETRSPDIKSKSISGITFSPDGTKFLMREDIRSGKQPSEFAEEPERVRIWDTASLNPVSDITKLTSPLAIVRFCKDSKTVAIGRSSFYGERDTLLNIIFASIDTKDIRGPRFISSETKSKPTVSPNGTSILTLGDDGIAQLWSLDPPNAGNKVVTDSAEFVDAGVDLYAQTIATINEKGDVKYWNGDDASQIGEQKLSPSMTRAIDSSSKPGIESDFSTYELFVSPTGNYSAIKDSSGHFTIWDIKKNGEVTLARSENGILEKNISFGRSSDILAMVNSANKISLWQNLQNPLHVETIDPAEEVTSLLFSRDDKYLACLNEHGTAVHVKVFEVKTHKEMKAPSDELVRETFRFGPNGILIARLPGENSILVFDVLTGNRLSLLHSSAITYLTLSPDGARLLTSTSDGTLWLWDTNTGNLLTQQKYDFRVLLLRISADGTTAVAFSDNWVHVFDITKDGMQYADGQLMAIRALGILKDASGRNLRKIWEMSPGKFEISDIAIPPKPNPATSAPNSSDVDEWQKKLSRKFDENGQLRPN